MTNSNAWKMAATLLLCAATVTASPAQTFTTLVNFGKYNGSDPAGSLIQSPDGNAYGTTTHGGFRDGGTVISITLDGALAAASFCLEADCPDGFYPFVGLLAADGSFYGTTWLGGSGSCFGDEGCGTVFKVTPQGTLTTLHSFNNADGANPFGVLIQGTDGNFYGTTEVGGYGWGTVFKITPQGTLTTLHRFDSTNGELPHGTLIQATDGNFYGTTYAGGEGYDVGCNANNVVGCGTVFRITPTGTLTTLHRFNVIDGSRPVAGLVQGADGNFYGTTYSGGSGSCYGGLGCGTVFKITPQGVLTTLHSFNNADGFQPRGELIEATDGNFYGTTYWGGNPICSPYGCGTVFQITPGGALTTVHLFDGTDGETPFGALLQDTNGAFYGTTEAGGLNYGTVFSLDMGLGPFVSLVHHVGEVGQTGGILGQEFIGTTSVSINGIEANFTVVSDTYISATVPAGATTGYVTVATPSGTLTSNVPFHVIP